MRNRREPIFFAEGDQAIYLALLREQAIGGHDTYSPSNLLTVNRYRRQALKDAGEHVCCPPIDPADEFGKNLEASGYSKSVSKDGNAINYTNGDKTYSVYKGNKGSSAQLKIGSSNQPVAKIRFDR